MEAIIITIGIALLGVAIVVKLSQRKKSKAKPDQTAPRRQDGGTIIPGRDSGEV